MKRCYLTLTQINYMSDLQSSQTQYAILRRLPDYLHEKWMEKSAIFDKFNREATYEEFLDFMEDRAAAFKTHIGQEVLRQRLERTKESEPDRLPRTLAMSDSTISTASSNGPQTPDEHPNNCQPRQKVCKYCNKEHWLHECDSFKN